jgi:hypothetical protein
MLGHTIAARPRRNYARKTANMTTLNSIAAFLEEFAPTRLAADWDNVGLLVGDRAAEVSRVMTCLTVTPESAAEWDVVARIDGAPPHATIGGKGE